MRRRLFRRGGFTLIELLIVVAIIGIIAALLVPNFLDSLQKAKQKRTMADARNIGGSMMGWLTDQSAAAAAGANNAFALSEWSGTSDFDEIRAQLVPRYLQELPALDGWKHSFLFRMQFGDPEARRFVLVASGGRGGTIDGNYTFGSFDPTDYDQDIIWADGLFFHWPERVVESP